MFLFFVLVFSFFFFPFFLFEREKRKRGKEEKDILSEDSVIPPRSFDLVLCFHVLD